jgi:hypothetical protein
MAGDDDELLAVFLDQGRLHQANRHDRGGHLGIEKLAGAATARVVRVGFQLAGVDGPEFHAVVLL